jgi:hypothetical protein
MIYNAPVESLCALDSPLPHLVLRSTADRILYPIGVAARSSCYGFLIDESDMPGSLWNGAPSESRVADAAVSWISRRTRRSPAFEE